MAARVNLDWKSIEFAGKGVASWRSLKKVVSLDDHPKLFSERAVYIIRVCRPFAFDYGDRYSPVAYIGKGQAQKRITAHLKIWIPHLSTKIPDLKEDLLLRAARPASRYDLRGRRGRPHSQVYRAAWAKAAEEPEHADRSAQADLLPR